MSSRFRHVALIGKYQASGARAQCGAHDNVMEGIGAFLESQGCKVFVEKSQTDPVETGPYPALTVEEIGQQCDLGLVVGGDGTMLGIGRQLAPHDVPLIGINRGRLGFVTDISLDNYQATLIPMLAGEYEEDRRSSLRGSIGSSSSTTTTRAGDVQAGRPPIRGRIDACRVGSGVAGGLVAVPSTAATVPSDSTTRLPLWNAFVVLRTAGRSQVRPPSSERLIPNTPVARSFSIVR